MSILVIGAGMAGAAAARASADAGQDVIVLEARDRVGGRVHTRRDIVNGVPVELGAEYLHGEKVPTWALVNELGLATLHWNKQDDSLVRLESGERLTMRQARAQHPDFDLTRSWDLPEVEPHPADEDLYHYLSRLGFTAEQLQYTRRSYANAMGESIHSISTHEAYSGWHDETAGTQDWRVMAGYDTLVKHLLDGIDVRLNTVVRHVDWEGDSVRVETDGDSFQAERVIITLPTGVLLESVSFSPPLPDEKRAAINDLRMGPGYKIVYVFDEPILPEGITALYSRHNPPMWWSPTFGHADAPQFAITAFATGDWARELEKLGETGIQQQGLQTLRAELDNVPDPTAVHIVDWTADPFAGGVYSVASPGAASRRSVLGEPLAGKLYWAGEATAKSTWSATVHGAYATGQRAAAQVIDASGDN